MVFLNSLLDLSHLWMPVRRYCLSTLRPMIRYVFPRFSSCVQGQSAPFFRYRVSCFRSFFFKGPSFTVFFLFCRITLRSVFSRLTSLILVFMAKENRDMDKVENMDKENSKNCDQLSESSPVGGEETEDYIILPVNISFQYFFKLSLLFISIMTCRFWAAWKSPHNVFKHCSHLLPLLWSIILQSFVQSCIVSLNCAALSLIYTKSSNPSGHVLGSERPRRVWVARGIAGGSQMSRAIKERLDC